MPSLADAIVSSSSRKLTIRVRPDLTARRQRYQGRVYWVVKDPVGLQYYRFEEEEFAILQMLDGESSLEEIAEQFEQDFPPQTIRVEELQNFIGMLHRSGLVLSDSLGQGHQLKQRRDEKKRKELLASLSNVLAFRFRGFDPERILEGIYPYVRWFFSTPATIFNLCLASLALTLVIVQFDVFQSRLPGFHAFFAAQNWLLMGAVLMVTKVLHEFGHGLSCKHFGGECHEMGVMFLVLTPCLYCNVSDSWMLPNRWHRAAIGAAGMYVEVVIASICTFIWWFTDQHAFINKICLNIMFVSSVSTIMFNANPLLRYDGYYILSDILEIPNLRQKASSILSRKLGKWCLGLEEPEDPFLPKRHQGLFALYTVASFFYRWFVLLSILFFLNKVFEPYGLKVIGQIIALASLYGLIVFPAWKVFKFFRVPGRLSKVKRWRMYVTLLLLAGVVSGVLLIPLPSSVHCLFELQSHDATSVYVEVEGVLVEQHVKPGQHVEQGDLLAVLENKNLTMRLESLLGEEKTLQTELGILERAPNRDRIVADRMGVVRESLTSVRDEIAQLETDIERLRIVAPASGTIIPPPRVPEKPVEPDMQLTSWTGSPLDEENLGAVLSPEGRQNLLCYIGDLNEWDAVLIVDQDDAERVGIGQSVRLMFEESAYHVYTSKVDHFAGYDEMEEVSTRLASTSGGPLPAQADRDGVVRPLTTSYQALARLDNRNGLLRNGLIGRAKIETEPRTIFNRLSEYVSRTFNFEL